MTEFIYKTGARTEEEARTRCLTNYKQSKIYKEVEKGNKTAIIKTVTLTDEGIYEITGRLE